MKAFIFAFLMAKLVGGRRAQTYMGLRQIVTDRGDYDSAKLCDQQRRMVK